MKVTHDESGPSVRGYRVIDDHESAGSQTLTRRDLVLDAHRPTIPDSWVRPELAARRVPVHDRGYEGEAVLRAYRRVLGFLDMPGLDVVLGRDEVGRFCRDPCLGSEKHTCGVGVDGRHGVEYRPRERGRDGKGGPMSLSGGM